MEGMRLGFLEIQYEKLLVLLLTDLPDSCFPSGLFLELAAPALSSALEESASLMDLPETLNSEKGLGC